MSSTTVPEGSTAVARPVASAEAGLVVHRKGEKVPGERLHFGFLTLDSDPAFILARLLNNLKNRFGQALEYSQSRARRQRSEMHIPSRITLLAFAGFGIAIGMSAGLAQAQQGVGGWVIKPTRYPFSVLADRLEGAVRAHQMNVVNFASASEGAKAQGITIPGNRVVGVFRNDFARRLLPLNLQAGIEAPIRFYLTEGADGTATLSYRTPGAILEPYFPRAPVELQALAKELDGLFDAIATEAAAP